MIVRRLRPGDEELAASVVNAVRLEEDPQGHAADADLMKGFLANESNYLVAAYDDDGTPLGFALGYGLNRVDQARDMMYFHEIGVMQDHQGRGIGKAIMNEMVRICREEGLLNMFLITGDHDTPAVRLYSSTGGRRGGDDALIFTYVF